MSYFSISFYAKPRKLFGCINLYYPWRYGFRKKQWKSKAFCSNTLVLDSEHRVKEQHIQRRTVAERLVAESPIYVQPYLKLMRIDRPIGTWLLFWPCSWSLTLATAPGTLPDPGVLGLMIAGSLIMRGAGCTINDMWDKKIDQKVERTKCRPLASNQITPINTWVFLGAQLSIGLLILLQFNWYSILLGISSLGLVISYPLMKRITYWPQLVLGLTFNWGALLGYAAVQGHCDWGICLPLYVSGVAWTLVYDTIYAHQDKIDDAIVGVKSTALKFGKSTYQWLTGFSLVTLTGFTVAGVAAEQSWPYYAAVLSSGAHLIYQVSTLKIDCSEDCAEKFKSNKYLGAVMFVGCVLGNLVKVSS